LTTTENHKKSPISCTQLSKTNNPKQKKYNPVYKNSRHLRPIKSSAKTLKQHKYSLILRIFLVKTKKTHISRTRFGNLNFIMYPLTK